MGDYPGRILRYTFGESSQKKTPYVRFTIALTGEWPEEVPEEDREGIELAGKTRDVDFFLTEDALYRLADLQKALGFSDGSLEENIAKMIGCDVVAHIVPEINQTTQESFSRIRGLTAS